MLFHIENMSCGGCARHVTRTIHGVDAGAAVDVNLAGRNVTIVSMASSASIMLALAADGYMATAI